MEAIEIRPMQPGDRHEVAELICISTNVWYQTHGRAAVFPGGPEAADVFCEVYGRLDPGCAVVAESMRSGRLTGSCFYHPRPTHVSLGIMNVHPNHFGRGIARQLLDAVLAVADRADKPLRLVSSALNVDSFSLYTRAGFVPRAAYQGLVVTVPGDGLPETADGALVREATAADVPAIVALEMELAGIDRQQDFRYFLDNREGFWHLSVCVGPGAGIEGFLASSGSAVLNIAGPGAARTAPQAIALVRAELNRHRGRSPVVFAPVEAEALVRQLYAWGARNSELILGQVRGRCPPMTGILLPTILPESG